MGSFSIYNWIVILIVLVIVLVIVGFFFALNKRTNQDQSGTKSRQSSMGKGVGIAALVVAIVAIIVPVYGLYASAIAIVLAVVSALAGDRMFATATPIIAGINTYLLSPSVWIMLKGLSSAGGSTASFHLLVVAFFVAPFIAMYLNSTGTITLGTGSLPLQEVKEQAAKAGNNLTTSQKTESLVLSSLQPAAPEFDRVKWNALIKYDDDIAVIAEQVRPLGQKWMDEFASAYLALNDKRYLEAIAQKIFKQANEEKARRAS